MVLAQPFYGSNYEVLLSTGMVLSKAVIRRINDMGYAGIYIEDELSSGIEANNIISQDLRIKTVKAAKELLQQAEKGTIPTKVTKEYQRKMIMPLINSIIESQSRIIDIIDLKPYEDYNYYHAANVVILSILIGFYMGVNGPQLYDLGMASLLHDVGNIFIPKSILNKPGKLTAEEFDIIKSHSQMGFEYLREHFELSIEACMGALQHHEHYDGTGYPNNLKQEKISIYGRIIAVTTVYDAYVTQTIPSRGVSSGGNGFHGSKLRNKL